MTGFQLSATDIAEGIHADLVRPGWSISLYLDSYVRPAWDGTGMLVRDSVDRAAVVFVGTRAQATAVEQAARAAAQSEVS